jgi:peptidoglycan/LPS O-acetylase OafA/YrhL
MVICIVAAVTLAWISWTVFESPILRLRDRFVVPSSARVTP